MPRPQTRETVRVEATAYCGCGRCCGWEYGIALGPCPVYLPLTRGRTRASGTRTLPLLPRRRRVRAHAPMDRARGLLVGTCVGAAVGAGVWAAKWGVSPLVRRGEIGLQGLLPDAAAAWRRACTTALTRDVEVGALSGAVLGASIMPVGRYWAETKLAGLPYGGRTASGTTPRHARPPLLSRDTIFHRPWTIPGRLLTLQIDGVEGTVAADTSHYPLGTRMRVPGWGTGVVEDRGGAIQGPHRIDLYYDTHCEALRWGRRRVPVTVVRRA